MKNEEKFTTVDERVKAFAAFCFTQKHCEYKVNNCDEARCFAKWLEAEYQPPNVRRCPFCKNECHTVTVENDIRGDSVLYSVRCATCGYRSRYCATEAKAGEEHNALAENCEKGAVTK